MDILYIKKGLQQGLTISNFRYSLERQSLKLHWNVHVCTCKHKDEMKKHKATLSRKLNFTNIHFLNEKKKFLPLP